MTTWAIFAVICALTVALWGLLYFATGQHRVRRRLRANQREHDRQMREFAHKEAVAPLERELGIKNSLTGQLLHPKPRKRLAYHPNGQLIDHAAAETIAAVQAVADAQRDYQRQLKRIKGFPR